MEERLKGIVEVYSGRIKALLGNDLIGIYLTGSVALDGYHDGKSDIDFTVVMKPPLEERQISELKIIHREILKKYPKNLFEGHYITPDVLGKSINETEPVVSYHNGKIVKDYHGINIVTWFTLKKYGVSVCGLPAKDLHFEAPEHELLKYVINNVNSYWAQWLSQASLNISKKSIFALSKQAVEWCVSGLSRMYYTLSEKDITSKDQALGYALRHAPRQYERIIKEAQYIRTGRDQKQYHSRMKRRKDMIQYMDYMIRECNKLYYS